MIGMYVWCICVVYVLPLYAYNVYVYDMYVCDVYVEKRDYSYWF